MTKVAVLRRPNHFCTAAADSSVSMWQLGAHHSAWDLRTGGEQARCCAFHSTQPHLAVGSNDGCMRVFDTTTRAAIHAMPQHHTPVVAVCYQPNGQRLFSLGGFCMLASQLLQCRPEPANHHLAVVCHKSQPSPLIHKSGIRGDGDCR